jgi:hypothetical protein
VIAANKSDPFLLEHIRAIFNLALNDIDGFYGLITVARADFDDFGSAYTLNGARTGLPNLREQIDSQRWLELGSMREHMLRGIYWGQYLSPYALRQLGGFSSFSGEVARFGNVQLLEEIGNGGAWFRLTPGPLNDSVYGHQIPSHEIGLWFARRVKSVGLLE